VHQTTPDVGFGALLRSKICAASGTLARKSADAVLTGEMQLGISIIPEQI
jgi:hypothetical protein